MSSLSSISRRTYLLALSSLTVFSLLAAGCGGGNTSATGTPGPSFVISTDAPMSSVTSFSVVVQSVDAIDAKGNSVSLVSGSPTIDFARYNGLQSLMDMNDVPAGTYTSVAITLGRATQLPEYDFWSADHQHRNRNPHHVHSQRHAGHTPGRHPVGSAGRPAPGFRFIQIDSNQ